MLENIESDVVKLIREDVEKKFGKKITYSKDCSLLSEQIQRVTNRRLSCSTLKRFFGVIHSEFNPSGYTIETLVHYLGFENLHSYLNCFDATKYNFHSPGTWEMLKSRIQIVTESSKNSLEQKTGYNPKQFVFRRFAKQFFESFIESEKTASILIAPTGYGKSTTILQWMDYYFTGTDSRFKNDLVGLIDGGNFFELYSKNHNVKLLNQLLDFDLKESFVSFFESNPGERKGRIFVVIDDIDGIFTSKEKFIEVAENILRIIMANQENSWFKIILTCTPENLKIFSTLVHRNLSLKDCWFNVNFSSQNQSDIINVPQLSREEIQTVLTNSNSKVSVDYIDLYQPGLLKIICNPWFLSLFISEDHTGQEFSEVGFLNNLIKRTIYSPPFAEEKQVLINKFFELCNYGQETNFVIKEKLVQDTGSLLGYLELCKSGILYESYVPESYFNIQCQVRFSNSMVFEYLKA